MSASAGGTSLRVKSIAGRSRHRNLAVCLSASFLAAGLLGCSGPAIQGITGQGGTLGGVTNFVLTGTGVCGMVQLDFGDGTSPVQVPDYDFANPKTISHTYTGWAGRKTVKAGSIQNCVGSPEIIFVVKPIKFSVGYVPTLADACGPIPNRPPLRKNTKVHVTAIPGAPDASGTPGPTAKINFGCPLNGCIYDEDGMAGAAPSNYPFPNFRPFSLVLRVGPDLYQGGTDATFTVKTAGTLEMCRNEGNFANHTGGWGVNIDVDESGAQ